MSPRLKKPENLKKVALSVRIEPEIEQALNAIVSENRSNMSIEVNRLLHKILVAEKRLKKT
jgi:hypothetical protein